MPKEKYKFYLIPPAHSCRLAYLPFMAPNPRPRRVIDCRNCLASFTHSEVGKDRKLIDYLLPTAPEFPPAGEELECPSCKTKAIYTRRDLRYRLE